MRRGDIYWVDLEPVRGSEANKVRPAVLVSNDAALRTSRPPKGLVTVVPITTNVARVFPFQVLLSADETGLDRDSKAQAEQVRTIAAGRLSRQVGRLTAAQSRQLDNALRLHLGLEKFFPQTSAVSATPAR